MPNNSRNNGIVSISDFGLGISDLKNKNLTRNKENDY